MPGLASAGTTSRTSYANVLPTSACVNATPFIFAISHATPSARAALVKLRSESAKRASASSADTVSDFTPWMLKENSSAAISRPFSVFWTVMPENCAFCSYLFSNFAGPLS